jgi:hypothetical protein
MRIALGRGIKIHEELVAPHDRSIEPNRDEKRSTKENTARASVLLDAFYMRLRHRLRD